MDILADDKVSVNCVAMAVECRLALGTVHYFIISNGGGYLVRAYL